MDFIELSKPTAGSGKGKMKKNKKKKEAKAKSQQQFQGERSKTSAQLIMTQIKPARPGEGISSICLRLPLSPLKRSH